MSKLVKDIMERQELFSSYIKKDKGLFEDVFKMVDDELNYIVENQQHLDLQECEVTNDTVIPDVLFERVEYAVAKQKEDMFQQALTECILYNIGDEDLKGYILEGKKWDKISGRINNKRHDEKPGNDHVRRNKKASDTGKDIRLDDEDSEQVTSSSSTEEVYEKTIKTLGYAKASQGVVRNRGAVKHLKKYARKLEKLMVSQGNVSPRDRRRQAVRKHKRALKNKDFMRGSELAKSRRTYRHNIMDSVDMDMLNTKYKGMDNQLREALVNTAAVLVESGYEQYDAKLEAMALVYKNINVYNDYITESYVELLSEPLQETEDSVQDIYNQLMESGKIDMSMREFGELIKEAVLVESKSTGFDVNRSSNIVKSRMIQNPDIYKDTNSAVLGNSIEIRVPKLDPNFFNDDTTGANVLYAKFDEELAEEIRYQVYTKGPLYALIEEIGHEYKTQGDSERLDELCEDFFCNVTGDDKDLSESATDIYKNIAKNYQPTLKYSFRDKHKLKQKIKGISTGVANLTKYLDNSGRLYTDNSEFDRIDELFNGIRDGEQHIKFNRNGSLGADDLQELSVATREINSLIDELYNDERKLEYSTKNNPDDILGNTDKYTSSMNTIDSLERKRHSIDQFLSHLLDFIQSKQK